jgi:hypothetical protein
MATDKQIAANRANAKRSTGPRTAAGKRRSGQNAYRHGLSGPLPDDIATIAVTDAIAGAVQNCFRNETSAETFSRAQMELLRISRVRRDLLANLVSAEPEARGLRRLAALDRYERLARTKMRRAELLISKPGARRR